MKQKEINYQFLILGNVVDKQVEKADFAMYQSLILGNVVIRRVYGYTTDEYQFLILGNVEDSEKYSLCHKGINS